MIKIVLNELVGKWRKLNGINFFLLNVVEDLVFFFRGGGFLFSFYFF